jgi:bacteriorhodopsin
MPGQHKTCPCFTPFHAALSVGPDWSAVSAVDSCALQLMWTGFGVVWDLRMAGLIDTNTEEVAYLCCDFAAKVRQPGALLLQLRGCSICRAGSKSWLCHSQQLGNSC